ncbi:hypothetical protein [Pseudonocardia spinosispora]|uniref:hypothetical protein n=1 Tax=Pseudonocardia spinosispora TaxID=103441 RepID=UPI00040E759C|nr:hypothetical protein [Pseudonocardia spinosispora]
MPSDDARTESGTRHREDHDSDHPASRDRRGAPVFEDRPYPDDTREPTFDHRHTPAPRGEPLDRPTPPAEDLPRTGDGDEPWQPSPTAAPSRRPAPYQRARPTPDSTVEPHTPYDPATPSVTPSDPTGEPTVDPAPPVRRHPDGYPHRRPAPDRQGHGGTYDEPGHPERPGRYDGSPSDG